MLVNFRALLKQAKNKVCNDGSHPLDATRNEQHHQRTMCNKSYRYRGVAKR